LIAVVQLYRRAIHDQIQHEATTVSLPVVKVIIVANFLS
jgi:hypothetical protein